MNKAIMRRVSKLEDACIIGPRSAAAQALLDRLALGRERVAKLLGVEQEPLQTTPGMSIIEILHAGRARCANRP